MKKSTTAYTDFPYCYDEERYFVSNMSMLNKHEQEQNIAIEKNTQTSIENIEIDKQQALDIADLKRRVTILEEEIKKILNGGTVTIADTITLWPDDNIPQSEEERQSLTLTPQDSFNDIIAKLSTAIKSLNNTVDGDIFKF